MKTDIMSFLNKIKSKDNLQSKKEMEDACENESEMHKHMETDESIAQRAHDQQDDFVVERFNSSKDR